MGPYLSTPNTEKDSETGGDARFQYSCCSMQGWRNQQEDSHIADVKLPNGEAIFGVFDGHGGKEVALFVQKHFVNVFKKLPEYKAGNYEAALTKAFITMDDMMDDDDNDNCFEQFVSKNDSDEEMAGAFASSDSARKYDLSITYDFFHQTPRMWLLGYSSEGALLTQQEMFEDIMADYAQKTVTYEEHPKLTQKQLSIHPCNHANAMKRIIAVIVENGGKPRAEFSLFVFLKFISSVTPTI